MMAGLAQRELALLRRLEAGNGSIKAPTQHDLDSIQALLYFKYVELPPLDGKNPVTNYEAEGYISVYAPLTERGKAVLRDSP
jgi:hypothetical protein